MEEGTLTTNNSPKGELLALLASWEPETERIPQPEDRPPEPVCLKEPEEPSL